MKIWEGIVEDRDDPLQMGRVRVRIFGYHSANLNEVPTNGLPWASILLPTTNASNSGIGHSPTGMVLGTRVVGYFIDGKEGQQPIIFGVLTQVHLENEEEIQDAFSDSLSQNGFIPEQEQFETLPVEVLYTMVIPGTSPLIINDIARIFPREKYINHSSVSKIAIENAENKHPHVKRKEQSIEEGGTVDTEIPIATVESDKYEVIPEKTTNSKKGEFVQYSEKFRNSTNSPSTIETFSSIKRQIRDSNGKCVYIDKPKNYSDDNLLQQIIREMQEFLNENIKSKEQLWAENPGLKTYRDELYE